MSIQLSERQLIAESVRRVLKLHKQWTNTSQESLSQALRNDYSVPQGLLKELSKELEFLNAQREMKNIKPLYYRIHASKNPSEKESSCGQQNITHRPSLYDILQTPDMNEIMEQIVIK